MKRLSKSELLEIELNHSNKIIEELKLNNIQAKKRNEMLDIKIKHLEAQARLQEIDKEVEAKKQEIEYVKSHIREFNNKIKKKYKIKGPFGINPDTGEIIID